MFHDGFYSFLPVLLALLAVVDAARRRAEFFWYLVVLFLPVVGPVAYFVATRFQSIDTSRPGGEAARRRLRELQVPLQNWRGGGLLAEAGEQLLVLGRIPEAEAHFREALQAGADPEDVNYGLAVVLQTQGRYAEAVPYLRALCETNKDVRVGDAQLALARCLDESGEGDEAETVLRDYLERHNAPEARVRLARRLLQRGDVAGAARLREEVRDDEQVYSDALMRIHGPWIRAARKLKTGRESLPKPKVANPRASTRGRLGVITVVAAAVVLGAFIFREVQTQTLYSGLMNRVRDVSSAGEGLEAARDGLAALAERFPQPGEQSLAEVTVSDAEVDAFVAIRRSIGEPWEQFRSVDSVAMAFDEGADFDVDEARNLYFRWATAATAVLDTLRTGLELYERGPTWFLEMMEIVDWRFLHREDAEILGVPSYYRRDYSLSLAAEGYGDLDESDAQDVRDKLSDLRARAREDISLTPETVACLERHRMELEALRPRGTRAFVELLDD